LDIDLILKHPHCRQVRMHYSALRKKSSKVSQAKPCPYFIDEHLHPDDLGLQNNCGHNNCVFLKDNESKKRKKAGSSQELPVPSRSVCLCECDSVTCANCAYCKGKPLVPKGFMTIQSNCVCPVCNCHCSKASQNARVCWMFCS
jgi:hypothetical protein